MAGRNDVIVVLGAAPLRNGAPSPAMIRRTRLGASLFHQGRGEFMIVSGGPVLHPTPEAEMMRAIALESGVPDERILVEDRAANTFENALFTGLLMERKGWRRALVVTDAFHLPRALFVFRTLGLDARGSANWERLGTSHWAWYAAYAREVAAILRSAGLFLAGRHKPAIARARKAVLTEPGR